MELEFATDRRTGFPCLRPANARAWVALLPITKLQVEQWVWSGGAAASTSGPYRVSQLVQRLSLADQAGAYPERVKQATRQPLREADGEAVSSLAATNLSLWTADEGSGADEVEFPTERSEWGRILRWIDGQIPSHSQWVETRLTFAEQSTRGLLAGALNSGLVLAPVVEALLSRLLHRVKASARGLPLMGHDGYELIRDRRQFKLNSIDGTVWRPAVAGESRLWPCLGQVDRSSSQVVLQPVLPVVTMRPRYGDAAVARGAGPLQLKRPTPQPPPARDNAPPRLDRGVLDRGQYLRNKNPMKLLCPICYGQLDATVFKSRRRVLCFTERMSQDGVPRTVRQHEPELPHSDRAVDRPEVIHREYLELARRHSQAIRSVSLAGFTRSGKTTWLLGLSGMLSYPAGNTRFTSAFPASWKLMPTICSTEDPRQQESINLAREMEQMWVLGDVPDRTRVQERALRWSVRFDCQQPRTLLGGLLRRAQREAMIVLNDIGGEATADALELARNKHLLHVKHSTDMVYLMPAHRLGQSAEHFARFCGALSSQEIDGGMIQPGEINLIVALSMIDLLKYRGGDAPELLEILLRQPHVLPDEGQASELAEYLRGMQQVDRDLASFLGEKLPNFANMASQFASVRCCGFSTFGFEPMRVGARPGAEASLPFAPRPVRVADPLLWLLLENGVIEAQPVDHRRAS